MMLNLITIVLYLISATTQAIAFRNKRHFASLLFTCCTIPALLFHGYLLYHWIDLTTGQNLTELNLLSLAAWLAAVIIVIMSPKQPLAYLGVVIFPLAAGSVFFATQFPSNHILHTAADPKQFIHILLSVLTFSVLSIAGIQALVLAVQEKILKQKYFAISRNVPAIETMEDSLFRLILVGVLLLSCLMATSIFFFHEVLLNQFLQKTILSIFAWLLFTSLLIGRHFLGWRGKKIVYCTLGGVAVLSTLYLGSMLIRGFLF